MHNKTTLFLSTITFFFLMGFSAQAEQTTPFEDIKFGCKDITVQYQGKWYDLEQVNGVSEKKLIAYSKFLDQNKWQKRITEDLAEVLELTGRIPSKFNLVLRGKSNGKIRKISDVSGSAEIRTQMHDNETWDKNSEKNCAVSRVTRTRTQSPIKSFEWITKTGYFGAVKNPEDWRLKKVSKKDAQEDIAQLEWYIDNYFAYATANGFNYKAALDEVYFALPDEITAGDFALQLQKVMAHFIDGHGPRVSGQGEKRRERISGRLSEKAYLPFAMKDVRQGIVAYVPKEGRFLDAKYPIITKIDGIVIADWQRAAKRVITRGSEQLMKRWSLGKLAYINYLRRDMSLPVRASVKVTLRSLDGMMTKDIELDLTGKRVSSRWKPSKELAAAIVPDDIAYIHVDRMYGSDEKMNWIKDWIRKNKGRKAAIIDIRDNGGGSRRPLLTILPHVMTKDSKPHVVNMAKFRVTESCADCKPEDGFLANRFAYLSGSSKWTADERKAVELAEEYFQPQWRVPMQGYSAWHYMAVTADPMSAFGGKPVIIIMNTGNFSASDIFLGGFKGVPNVTLLGTPSSGGSARTKRYSLAHSNISVNLASMASFVPNTGRLYDGNGIQADIYLKPVAADLLHTQDSILKRAVELINAHETTSD